MGAGPSEAQLLPGPAGPPVILGSASARLPPPGPPGSGKSADSLRRHGRPWAPLHLFPRVQFGGAQHAPGGTGGWMDGRTQSSAAARETSRWSDRERSPVRPPSIFLLKEENTKKKRTKKKPFACQLGAGGQGKARAAPAPVTEASVPRRMALCARWPRLRRAQWFPLTPPRAQRGLGLLGRKGSRGPRVHTLRAPGPLCPAPSWRRTLGESGHHCHRWLGDTSVPRVTGGPVPTRPSVPSPPPHAEDGTGSLAPLGAGWG